MSSGGSCRSPSISTTAFLAAISMPLRNAACEPKLRECVMPSTRGFGGRERADRLLGIVGAAVVHEDDLVVDVELCKHALEPLGHDGDRLPVLVAGDDDARRCRRCRARASSRRARTSRRRRAPRTSAPCARSPSSSETSARHPSWAAARAGFAYQSLRSQARAGIVENSGSASSAEFALREVGELADRGLAAAADVEGGSVVIGTQQHRRAQKGAHRIVDVEEIARGVGVDEGRQAALRPRAPPASESSASGPRADRRPNKAAGSRSAIRDDVRRKYTRPAAAFLVTA